MGDMRGAPPRQPSSTTISPGTVTRASANVLPAGMGGRPVPLRRLIMGVAGREQQVGHLNDDPLDCRRENRQSQNLGIKLAACGRVANDRAKTGDEQHFDVFRPCRREISIGLS